jgi:hypothetical protein
MPTPKHMRLLTRQVFGQVERRFHSQESNRQPLPLDLSISPSSFSSLRSSRPNYIKYDIHCHMVFKVTMVSFQMTLVMNKLTYTVMDNG